MRSSNKNGTNIGIKLLYSHRMNIMDYISNDYTALPLRAKVDDVKAFFKELPYTHFPIVENGKLVGMISKDDVINLSNEEAELNDYHSVFEFYSARAPIHCIDLFNFFAQHNTNILPLVTNNQDYLGYFELDEIVHLFNSTPFLQENSTTLIIEKDKNNYSMSEIAQIIESNNSQLLGMYISEINDTTNQITLRLGTEDVNEVTQSLRRYGYHLLSQNKDDMLIEQLKDRADYLQKYLDF